MSLYIRDIAHCRGVDCPIAKSCRRHKLAIEAGNRREIEKDPYAFIPWVQEAYENGTCPNYFNQKNLWQ